LAVAERREIKGDLATVRSGWWLLVPVVVSGEMGRNTGEGRMKCGMLRGCLREAFVGAVAEGSGRGWR
jgi:hypothetical protein